MSDYTIAAIPTLYRGRQYRSRLEARWAAFFDLLGWSAEYEPFDLGKWSPDFRLRPLTSFGEPVLAEIKPWESFDAATATRMADAASKSNSSDSAVIILLTRLAPVLIYLGSFEATVDYEAHNNIALSIGWLGEVPCVNDLSIKTFWSSAFIVWTHDDDRPCLIADIGVIEPNLSHRRQSWGGVLTRRSAYSDQMGILCHPAFYPQHSQSVWAQATNLVQYQREARQ